MSKLYANVAGMGGILSVTVSESHSSATATAVVTCRELNVDIGDLITIDLGYADGNYDQVFKGYVKIIERKVPDNVYTVTCNDYLIRAVDYFIASSTPDSPTKYTNIAAETLVENVLAMAGVGNLDLQATSFTFAVNGTEAIVNLVSAYDYCKQIADTLAWNLWCDRDGITHFRNRKPYIMTGDSGQPGDIADTPIALTITNRTNTNIMDWVYKVSEKDLRNKVIVCGGQDSGISATAEADSPYLPPGFRKTVYFAHQIVDSQDMAQNAANYNLALLNRLNRSVSCTVLGDPSLQARKVVHVDEIITGVHENMYIYSCDHNFSAAGYLCNLELRG